MRNLTKKEVQEAKAYFPGKESLIDLIADKNINKLINPLLPKPKTNEKKNKG